MYTSNTTRQLSILTPGDNGEGDKINNQHDFDERSITSLKTRTDDLIDLDEADIELSGKGNLSFADSDVHLFNAVNGFNSPDDSDSSTSSDSSSTLEIQVSRYVQLH